MLLRKRNRSVKCSKYFKGIYSFQSYWNYFSTNQFGVIEKTSGLCTNAFAFLWYKEISCFPIILKLALSVRLLLVSMIVIFRQTFICWQDTLPASFLPALASMETHVDVEIQHGTILGRDTIFKNHSYSSDDEWTREELGLPLKEEEASLYPQQSCRSQTRLGMLCTPSDKMIPKTSGKVWADTSSHTCQYPVLSSLCS